MAIEWPLIHDHSSIVLDLVVQPAEPGEQLGWPFVPGAGSAAFLPFHPTNNPPSRRWAGRQARFLRRWHAATCIRRKASRIHRVLFFFLFFFLVDPHADRINRVVWNLLDSADFYSAAFSGLFDVIQCDIFWKFVRFSIVNLGHLWEINFNLISEIRG